MLNDVVHDMVSDIKDKSIQRLPSSSVFPTRLHDTKDNRSTSRTQPTNHGSFGPESNVVIEGSAKSTNGEKISTEARLILQMVSL